MTCGIHLPHAGDQATIRRHTEMAEDPGVASIWVSGLIIVPRDRFPRAKLCYDPVLSLIWAAAVHWFTIVG